MHVILGFTVFITARFLVFIWINAALVLGIFNTRFACVLTRCRWPCVPPAGLYLLLVPKPSDAVPSSPAWLADCQSHITFHAGRSFGTTGIKRANKAAEKPSLNIGQLEGRSAWAKPALPLTTGYLVSHADV